MAFSRGLAKTLSCAILVSATLLAVGMTDARAATYTVNYLADWADPDPGDGICAGNGNPNLCTLRAAIQTANAHPGNDTVVVPAGNEMDLHLGALPVTDSVTIGTPVGTAHATIKSDGTDRVFNISDGVTSVNMIRLDITGGAPPSSEDYGGGIHFPGTANGTLQMYDCVLYGNNAGTFGGAIYSDHSLALLDVEIRDNVGGLGAAISVESPVINGSVSVSIADSSIHNNTSNLGPAYYTAALDLRSLAGIDIQNTTISGNPPDAFFVTSSPITLRNVTITGSTRNGFVYANSSQNQTLPDVHVYNSIIAGNGTNCYVSGSFSTDFAYNLYGDNTCPGGFLPNQFNTDPKLAPLARRGNGLPLHELKAGSPAIDAGDPRSPTTCTALDQDGRTRGSGATGTRCDVGAAEFDDVIFRNGFE